MSILYLTASVLLILGIPSASHAASLTDLSDLIPWGNSLVHDPNAGISPQEKSQPETPQSSAGKPQSDSFPQQKSPSAETAELPLKLESAISAVSSNSKMMEEAEAQPDAPLSGKVVSVEDEELVEDLESRPTVCKRVRSPCSCMTNKGLVDLSRLEYNGSPTPRFENTDDPERTYYYSPCRPFSKFGDRSCNNVSVCQGYPMFNPQYFWEFGFHSSSMFTNDTDTGKLQLVYQHPTLDRRAYVTLQCNRNETGKLTLDSADGTTFVKFTLTSRFACPVKSHRYKDDDGLDYDTVLHIAVVAAGAACIVVTFCILVTCCSAKSNKQSKGKPKTSAPPPPAATVHSKDGAVFILHPVQAAVKKMQKV